MRRRVLDMASLAGDAAAMAYAKEPLYRRVNTRTRGVFQGGGEYRWSRHARQEDKASRGAMRRKEHGLDYTPLFRFLLSRVGGDWTEIRREAESRLDKPEPISWLVARTKEEGQPYVLVGESTYYSGLYVDDDNRLRIVDPDLRNEDMRPSCACCTHTFNGVRFVQRWEFGSGVLDSGKP